MVLLLGAEGHEVDDVPRVVGEKDGFATAAESEISVKYGRYRSKLRNKEKVTAERTPVERDECEDILSILKQRARTHRLEHDKEIKESHKYWKVVAGKKEWDTVVADLEVYRNGAINTYHRV